MKPVITKLLPLNLLAELPQNPLRKGRTSVFRVIAQSSSEITVVAIFMTALQEALKNAVLPACNMTGQSCYYSGLCKRVLIRSCPMLFQFFHLVVARPEFEESTCEGLIQFLWVYQNHPTQDPCLEQGSKNAYKREPKNGSLNEIFPKVPRTAKRPVFRPGHMTLPLAQLNVHLDHWLLSALSQVPSRKLFHIIHSYISLVVGRQNPAFSHWPKMFSINRNSPCYT